jgi:4-coumarate--CoA ligase
MYALSLTLHSALYMGIPVYAMAKFDLVEFCEVVQNEKITHANLVPPIMLHLARNPIVEDYDLSSLEVVISGAAPLGADLSMQVKKRFTKLVIKQAYGLTETSPVAVYEITDNVQEGKFRRFCCSYLSQEIQ